MAYSKSGWYLHTLSDALLGVAQTGTPTKIVATQSANLYASLQSNAGTDYTGVLDYHAASPAWANTNEIISSGGGWNVSGGVILNTAAATADVTPTLTITGAGPYALTYTFTSAISVANTTITGAYGMLIYFHDITAAVNKPMLLGLAFGAGYSTVAGVFGVTPSGSGLSALTLTQ